jgi:hypothetical protein
LVVVVRSGRRAIRSASGIIARGELRSTAGQAEQHSSAGYSRFHKVLHLGAGRPSHSAIVVSFKETKTDAQMKSGKRFSRILVGHEETATILIRNRRTR